MRRRLEDSVAGRDHVKRGWGGYVDVEFLVQYHLLGLSRDQLPHPAGTATCLARLGELGRIPTAAVSALTTDMAFLRFVEGRMRLWTGTAVSSLPTDADGRLRLARRCGFPSIATLDERLHLTRESIRRWFDHLVPE
jgi:glutamine synthetase adenylyltransferase